MTRTKGMVPSPIFWYDVKIAVTICRNLGDYIYSALAKVWIDVYELNLNIYNVKKMRRLQ